MCGEEDQCALQHPKSRLPYKWQYKKDNEAWKTFKNDLNDIIEKSFCDPTRTNIKYVVIHSISFQFEKIICKHPKQLSKEQYLTLQK